MPSKCQHFPGPLLITDFSGSNLRVSSLYSSSLLFPELETHGPSRLLDASHVPQTWHHFLPLHVFLSCSDSRDQQCCDPSSQARGLGMVTDFCLPDSLSEPKSSHSSSTPSPSFPPPCNLAPLKATPLIYLPRWLHQFPTWPHCLSLSISQSVFHSASRTIFLKSKSDCDTPFK